MVESVKALRRDEYSLAQSTASVLHGRTNIPFHALHALLDEAPAERDAAATRALIVRGGSRAIALDVDAVVGSQELVLKRMGPQTARVPGLLGVTLLGNGEIVLVYNPLELVASDTRAGRGRPGALDDVLAQKVNPLAGIPSVTPLETVPERQTAVVVPLRPKPKVDEKPLVMVVDDSLTVRKITTRFLEREGYRAISAKDGMEALTLLGEHQPAVILLDIEMPRMDGFEFTRAAKGDPKFRSIPIIMITSRTAEKHRSHAKELGVNAYLGKPYQDDELLRNIKQFIGGQ
jgi:chemosensory pili system protein ChpA (sensor histidine kinase/response regulator)